MAEERLDERNEAERFEPVNNEDADRPKTPAEREAEKQRRLAELEEEERRKKEEEKRQKELALRRDKRKLITPGVVLVIGAIASITMFLMRFETGRMLRWLLVILLAAWFAGSLIQFMFEQFARQNEASVSDEGEVINKGVVGSEGVED